MSFDVRQLTIASGFQTRGIHVISYMGALAIIGRVLRTSSQYYQA